MFSFFSSSNGIPGLTSDRKTPGGVVIAGALNAGDSGATTVPQFHGIYGSTSFVDSPGNNVDGDDVVDISQIASLSGDSIAHALFISRSSALNGHDYINPIFSVADTTDSTAPLQNWTKHGIAQLQVDGDGIQVHGKFKTGSTVTHTLGSYSGNSVPIYDESGTLLGYMPLYA